MFVLLVQSPNHPSQQHKFWGNVQMSPSYYKTIKTTLSSILLAQLVLMHGRYKFPTLFYSKYSILHFIAKKSIFLPATQFWTHQTTAYHHKVSITTNATSREWTEHFTRQKHTLHLRYGWKTYKNYCKGILICQKIVFPDTIPSIDVVFFDVFLIHFKKKFKVEFFFRRIKKSQTVHPDAGFRWFTSFLNRVQHRGATRMSFFNFSLGGPPPHRNAFWCRMPMRHGPTSKDTKNRL